ncbi:cytochrome P450 [Methylobacterium sp. 4-46]|uniref:cytochrome P450 n=1 Tax=unclassified Methylobacterium TaxID=2615210 RepID=UPI000165C9CF|nr:MULTISPECIES: cytochrome P450 [Methylobacterium]ACA16974.1 cytochrome P450 [Methylobacterium sp. 4-46]WFT83563.1 cytochrome P450 [Methylobacterium nodulans]
MSAVDAAERARRFDLRRLPEGFIEDPYPVYAALRTHAPVHVFAPGQVLLTRYVDLERVYKDAATFSSDKVVEFGAKFGPSPLYAHHTTSLVFNDPPRHTRVRRIIAGALAPRAIASMEASIVALVDGLLDAAEERGRIDLIEDFAAAIPVEVIGNLLGVPRAEREPLRAWSLAILGALEPVLDAATMEAGNRAVTEFLDYLKRLVAERRRRLGDPERDILTRLIQGEMEGERLSPEELLQNCIFILNAGHETTTNLIGNGLHLLTQWPEARERLLSEPDLLRRAVEEMLRFESSNQLGNRIAAKPFALGGRDFPAGTQITLGIGAANRDPDQFPDPDRFDVAREPNRHLAFASGIHQCVGMTVARLEGRIAIGRFLARFPSYALDGPPLRSRRVRFRGFSRLPARVEA